MIHAILEDLQPNDFDNWHELSANCCADSRDEYGWFHLRIGATDTVGTNDFQLCVSTPRASGRAKRHGFVPGVVVEQFTEETIRRVVQSKVESIVELDWCQIVEKLRVFMEWEYDGMS